MNLRFPRFRRRRNVRIVLTERDHKIIRLVHQHRFLRSWQICALTSDNVRGVLRRLQRLYHSGFLERPRAQLDYFFRGGPQHFVYGIGKYDGAILKQHGVATGRDWGKKNRAIGRIFLQHALLVSDVMVAIEIACRRDGIQLLTKNDLNIELMAAKEWGKIGVTPDRIFGLEYRGSDGKAKRFYFFLEADRGTMPVIRRKLSQTSFYRKLVGYETLWRRDIHRTQFGFHRFRVLTITTNKARLKTIIDACSRLQHGRGLFLFADKTVLQRNILSAEWKNAFGRAEDILS